MLCQNEYMTKSKPTKHFIFISILIDADTDIYVTQRIMIEIIVTSHTLILISISTPNNLSITFTGVTKDYTVYTSVFEIYINIQYTNYYIQFLI